MLLEICPKLHVSSNTKVDTVLFLDCFDKRIIALIAQLPIIISRTISLHASGIIMMTHIISRFVICEGSTTSFSPFIRPALTVTARESFEIIREIFSGERPSLVFGALYKLAVVIVKC